MEARPMATYFKLTLLGILSAAILSCNSTPVSSTVPASQISDPRPGFTLLSWQASDGRSRYILMSHDAAHSFLRAFDESKTPLENAKRFGCRIRDLATLKHVLLSLPPGAPISWHDDLSLGLVHAPLEEMNELCSFAEGHHLQFSGCY